jgi:hypothetical protein
LAAGLFLGAGGETKDIWVVANNQLAQANGKVSPS